MTSKYRHPAVTAVLTLLTAPLLLSGCGTAQSVDLAEWFTVTSPAFRDGGQMPSRFACGAYSGGQGRTPPLRWSNPNPTTAFAIVVDDPDASEGAYVHWVIANIPGTTNELVEGTRPDKTTVEGLNTGKKVGYTPPCPPKGERHRYRFTIYALSERVELNRGATLKDSLSTIAKYTVGRGRITGYFGTTGP